MINSGTVSNNSKLLSMINAGNTAMNMFSKLKGGAVAAAPVGGAEAAGGAEAGGMAAPGAYSLGAGAGAAGAGEAAAGAPSLMELAGLLSKGGKVPGKEVVKGDSPKNDIVYTGLSAGEEVLPKSVTQAKNAPEKAKKFMEDEKKGAKKMAEGGKVESTPMSRMKESSQNDPRVLVREALQHADNPDLPLDYETRMSIIEPLLRVKHFCLGGKV